MKIELLILIKNDDSFCNTKKAFVDFLKLDSLISITGKKLTYKKTARAKPLITVNFDVETNNIPSNKERYFIIALENKNDELIDAFYELGNKIKELTKRINTETTIVNVLWDDVGRHYAYKAYPLINDVENVMRKLISKFMLINVGMEWSKETIHPDLVKKIERFDEDDVYLNDLYKLDFINLSEVLFQKKRDITLEELDKIIIKTKFDDIDKDKILKYVPRSNWEKYFSELLGEEAKSLEAQWKLLYKLRNKVAHNRFLTLEDYNRIKGLALKVKEVLIVAMNKLGEINLDDEDRNQIISGYQSKDPYAFSFLSEKLVAEFYMENGFKVEQPELKNGRALVDFIIRNSDEIIAVEIKSLQSYSSIARVNHILKRGVRSVEDFIEQNNIAKGIVVLTIRADADESEIFKLIDSLKIINNENNPKLKINIGIVYEGDHIEFIEL
ncbi:MULTISPECIES: HEPN domain-containing protein [Raoultella]|uniref:HEPN domain-containing protein n=1 Tax=Raoultella TaxID=160674 RepID=UPI0021674DF7|nr:MULTISPECIES: HEPN domain-containing protein [Raoultella]MCS4274453.1 Holliday junction resolvase-like predicted endonuclease [Raoultella sp. BIGb0132]MCS4291800.1 Holliday junction resolvase-like predicted endonuclease [Raoultella terrigena]